MSINVSDLEEKIYECWNIVDDVKAVYTLHKDINKLNPDEMVNALTAVHNLYQIKFKLLHDSFEKRVDETRLLQEAFKECLEEIREASNEESSAVDYKLKPLTDEEADALLGKLSVGAVREDIRIIEAAHGIKGG